MNVAWITHRIWDPSLGGAEAADFDMANRRPDGVEITVVWPGGIAADLEEFDRIIVSGIYAFSSRELNALQAYKDKMTFWVHDSQFAGHWFYTVPNKLIFVSEQHQIHDMAKLPGFEPPHSFINPGWMDVAEIEVLRTNTREEAALWAHRPAPQKGLDAAADWAKSQGVRLDVLVNRPRDEILRAMWAHRYFVMLPHIFDSAPRAVIEAQLTEAELIINDNVGWFNESTNTLAERMTNADKEFWEVVLS